MSSKTDPSIHLRSVLNKRRKRRPDGLIVSAVSVRVTRPRSKLHFVTLTTFDIFVYLWFASECRDESIGVCPRHPVGCHRKSGRASADVKPRGASICWPWRVFLTLFPSSEVTVRPRGALVNASPVKTRLDSKARFWRARQLGPKPQTCVMRRALTAVVALV